MEELDEVVELNFERLGTVSFETVRNTQTPEAPRINEAQFPARSQLRDQVGVFCHFAVRGGDHHATGHSQVDDPLGF